MKSWTFWVHFTAEADGVWVTLESRRAGPFADDAAANAHVEGVVARWRARAERLGGRVERVARRKIAVTLPDGVEVRGGEPLVDERRR